MADPHYELHEHLTPVNYGLNNEETEILIALLQATGLNTASAVLDLALWKLAAWYDIPMPKDAFDLGRRCQRDRQRSRGKEIA